MTGDVSDQDVLNALGGLHRVRTTPLREVYVRRNLLRHNPEARKALGRALKQLAHYDWCTRVNLGIALASAANAFAINRRARTDHEYPKTREVRSELLRWKASLDALWEGVYEAESDTNPARHHVFVTIGARADTDELARQLLRARRAVDEELERLPEHPRRPDYPTQLLIHSLYRAIERYTGQPPKPPWRDRVSEEYGGHLFVLVRAAFGMCQIHKSDHRIAQAVGTYLNGQ